MNENNNTITELNYEIRLRDNNIKNLIDNNKNSENKCISNENYIRDLKKQIDNLKIVCNDNKDLENKI